MTFKLSQRSLNRLKGVNEDLVNVVKRAIELSELDFGVTEGLRTVERQKQLIKDGKSQTMKSKHINGDAVDVVAYRNGEVTWDINEYITVAEAFSKAAKELDVDLVWGAAWTSRLNKCVSADAAFEAYIEKRRQQGRKPFLDGPHFELGTEYS